MTSPMADSIRRGLEQAVALANGMADGSQFQVHLPQAVDVRKIRSGLGMTQQEFSRHFGFSINVLRHWEQGKRIPDGPARAYLIVIAKDPAAVQRALRAA